MNSMENFFNWMSKPIPQDEVIIWFNVHNMNYERIELYGDIFKSLNYVIIDTYMGEETNETKISLSQEDKESHFIWCWNKTVENFSKENIFFVKTDESYEYFKSFFMDVFYNQDQEVVKNSLNDFFTSIFSRKNQHSKSDIEMFTELYKLLEKSLEV